MIAAGAASARARSASTLTRGEPCPHAAARDYGRLRRERRMPEFRTGDAGQAKLRVAIEGEGPLVLMVHGFPESWFSWRHQIPAIAEAGFTAAAIDVRGYGGSDKPLEVAAYDMESLTGD